MVPCCDKGVVVFVYFSAVASIDASGVVVATAVAIVELMLTLLL